jgi:hemerythrin-like domain-containing protein
LSSGSPFPRRGRKMKATDILVREHEDIRALLAIVLEMCRRLEEGVGVPPDHLEEAVELIRGYADNYHHAKEEDLLFPEMERKGIPRDSGPIGVMLAEHDEGRAYVRDAADAIGRYREGHEPARLVIAANLRNYAGLLDQHIEKENQVLYPMADQQMDDPDQDQLLRRFNETDQTGDAPERHARYQSLLGELRSAYRYGGSAGSGGERRRPGASR